MVYRYIYVYTYMYICMFIDTFMNTHSYRNEHLLHIYFVINKFCYVFSFAKCEQRHVYQSNVNLWCLYFLWIEFNINSLRLFCYLKAMYSTLWQTGECNFYFVNIFTFDYHYLSPFKFRDEYTAETVPGKRLTFADEHGEILVVVRIIKYFNNTLKIAIIHLDILSLFLQKCYYLLITLIFLLVFCGYFFIRFLCLYPLTDIKILP
jgi:hypothetical protein